ncbi:MAG TPA: hypothetical protein VMH01_14975 [Puia sp.]|nr:hypothetical protein [Puia sp.]
MADLITRIWNNLVARTEGPMHLRFLLQPLMSLIFAIRAGFRDAKNQQVPYLWRLMATKGQRKEIVREAWKDVGKIFIIGTILDIIYQLIVIYGLKKQNRFYPLESILVAFGLALLPYIIFRGPADRIIRMFTRKKN